MVLVSQKSRVSTLEQMIQDSRIDLFDFFFPEYVVAADRFEQVAGNLKAFFDRRETPLFGKKEEGKEPSLTYGISVAEWRRRLLENILCYPHRIEFDIAKFGLEHLLLKVKEAKQIEYRPREACKEPKSKLNYYIFKSG